MTPFIRDVWPRTAKSDLEITVFQILGQGWRFEVNFAYVSWKSKLDPEWPIWLKMTPNKNYKIHIKVRNGCLKVSRTLTLSDLSFQLIDEKGSDKITKLRKFDNDFF